MSIEVKNVSKSYKKTKALDCVSLTFESNKIYGLLGRNGAGKTTLLNIISNRVFPTSGEVLIDSVPARENNKSLSKVFLMSEATLYPGDMKVRGVFLRSKSFYPGFDMEYANKLAARFGLDTLKKVRQLSTGMTSVMKIIVALSVNTPYVFFDEPVLGLDANCRELFYKVLIEKYIDFPCTIVISTHLIDEISSVIENAVIIDSGRILINKSRDELLEAGYSVSGKCRDVDYFISDKEIIGEDVMGALKTAYIIGKTDNVPDNLETAPLDLQKLFIRLTQQKEK